MINDDYAELYTKLLLNGFNKDDYSEIIARLVLNSSLPITDDEALELLIMSKVSLSDLNLLEKIGQENYDLIVTLEEGQQKESLKLYECYYTLSEMLQLKADGLNDGYSQQTDDYIGLTKDSRGISSISKLIRMSNVIIRRWYGCEAMS